MKAFPAHWQEMGAYTGDLTSVFSASTPVQGLCILAMSPLVQEEFLLPPMVIPNNASLEFVHAYHVLRSLDLVQDFFRLHFLHVVELPDSSGPLAQNV